MLLPAKCFFCDGLDPACARCGGAGTIALGVDLAAPVWTRKCPDCGWTNGFYNPQGVDWIPKEGQPVCETYAHRENLRGMDFCMRCRGPDGHPKHGHMIWTRMN